VNLPRRAQLTGQETIMTFRAWRVLPLAAFLIAGPGAGRAVAADGSRDEPEPARAWPGQTNPSNDSAETRNEDRESSKKEHLRAGVIAGVGFPRPLAIEGLIKIERTLALGVEYSVLPKLTVSGVETSFWAVAADARLFPFGGPFFVGLRAGRQHLGGRGSVTVAQIGSVTESLEVDTTFLNPRLGFLWTWEPGITLGIDAGAQIAIASSESSSLPSGLSITRDVNGVANSLGRTTLPTVDLLKIGFLL
jgi:hypothetical protein